MSYIYNKKKHNKKPSARFWRGQRLCFNLLYFTKLNFVQFSTFYTSCQVLNLNKNKHREVLLKCLSCLAYLACGYAKYNILFFKSQEVEVINYLFLAERYLLCKDSGLTKSLKFRATRTNVILCYIYGCFTLYDLYIIVFQ